MKVLAFLELARLILSLVPLLVSAIKAVEEAIPGNGYGEQKLAMVRGIIESAHKFASDGVTNFAEVWPALESTIGAIVKAFNETGVFRKG